MENKNTVRAYLIVEGVNRILNPKSRIPMGFSQSASLDYMKRSISETVEQKEQQIEKLKSAQKYLENFKETY